MVFDGALRRDRNRTVRRRPRGEPVGLSFGLRWERGRHCRRPAGGVGPARASRSAQEPCARRHVRRRQRQCQRLGGMDPLSQRLSHSGRGLHVLPLACSRAGLHASRYRSPLPRPGAREHAGAFPSGMAGGSHRVVRSVRDWWRAGSIGGHRHAASRRRPTDSARSGRHFRFGQWHRLRRHQRGPGGVYHASRPRDRHGRLQYLPVSGARVRVVRAGSRHHAARVHRRLRSGGGPRASSARSPAPFSGCKPGIFGPAESVSGIRGM